MWPTPYLECRTVEPIHQGQAAMARPGMDPSVNFMDLNMTIIEGKLETTLYENLRTSASIFLQVHPTQRGCSPELSLEKSFEQGSFVQDNSPIL